MVVHSKLCQLMHYAIQMDEPVFNYDLERMKEALEAPSYKLPPNLSFEEFMEWMKKHESNIRTV